jgi:hypothetical protein
VVNRQVGHVNNSGRDPDAVRTDLTGVVHTALAPTHVSVWIREDWVAGRFGEVHGYPGEPLAAPPLPSVPLKPR